MHPRIQIPKHNSSKKSYYMIRKMCEQIVVLYNQWFLTKAASALLVVIESAPAVLGSGAFDAQHL